MFFFILRLQIISASVDELTCKFVDLTGRKHVIHANITVGPKVLAQGDQTSFNLIMSREELMINSKESYYKC